MNDVEKFVKEALEIVAREEFHFMKNDNDEPYYCQTPERIPQFIKGDPRCIGCTIGMRMDAQASDNPLATETTFLYGNDRITALDRLIELATQPTDLPRIVEPAQ